MKFVPFVDRFLREIVGEYIINSMDSNNVAIVFAPTIFRPDMTDPSKAIMEVRLSQIIIKEIIDRKTILYEVMKSFKNQGIEKLTRSEQKLIAANPVMSVFSLQLLRPEAKTPIEIEDSLQIRAPVADLSIEDLNHSLSPSMISRMTKGNGRDEVLNKRAL